MQINSGVSGLYQTMAAAKTSGFGKAQGVAQGETVSAAGANKGTGRVDFSHMSRNQMQTVANQMYEQGAINVDQLTSITLAGPIGWAGPNGEFIPFTSSERAAIDAQPMDYTKMVSDVISGIESRGATTDPQSGYQNWVHLRTAMLQWQGRTSSADISV